MVLVLRQAGCGTSLTAGRGPGTILTAGRSCYQSDGRQVVVLVLLQAGRGTSLTEGRSWCQS